MSNTGISSSGKKYMWWIGALLVVFIALFFIQNNGSSASGLPGHISTSPADARPGEQVEPSADQAHGNSRPATPGVTDSVLSRPKP